MEKVVSRDRTMALLKAVFHDTSDRSSSDMIPIPVTNFTGRLPFPDKCPFRGYPRLVGKRSFLATFDIKPVSGGHLLRFARVHGDMSFAQSFSLLRMAHVVPVE